MLPTDPIARKRIPIWSGFVKYFPKSMAAIALLSRIANEQHSPGTPVHWDKSKSADELDALMRHLDEIAQGIDYDTDNILMDIKVGWRALANLERKLDAGVPMMRPAPIIVKPGTVIVHTCDAGSQPYAFGECVLCPACALTDVWTFR